MDWEIDFTDKGKNNTLTRQNLNDVMMTEFRIFILNMNNSELNLSLLHNCAITEAIKNKFKCSKYMYTYTVIHVYVHVYQIDTLALHGNKIT